MKTFTEILELVGAKKSGANWLAQCRAHDDRSPSLAIAEGDDGRTLLNCHAGCSVESILSAFDLTWADVLPARERTRVTRTSWEIRDVSGELIAEHVRVEGPSRREPRDVQVVVLRDEPTLPLRALRLGERELPN